MHLSSRPAPQASAFGSAFAPPGHRPDLHAILDWNLIGIEPEMNAAAMRHLPTSHDLRLESAMHSSDVGAADCYGGLAEDPLHHRASAVRLSAFDRRKRRSRKVFTVAGEMSRSL